ncbi:MAG: sigma-54-dependent Fis family transcriptional regulator [Deltaproteobacteria bacterium]|nr:sigma-54-dependent Fis family transcriptional regulator [Deltaproteobacteria bacterium]
MVARAIHYSGARADQPFVAVNCAAIPEGLFESELFGHKRGAFTGAVSDRVGYLQAAHGGTLFLDEVGDMPPSAQVKLLRALAERKVTPVGDVKEVEVDVRLITATNRNLADDVRAGRFREDLYYRLKVVSVELPPLRDRGDDVRQLAEHFLREYAREYQKRVRALHPDALERLHAHAWPGNVRELRNVMEAAVAMCEGDIVRPEDLPLEARAARPSVLGVSAAPAGVPSVEDFPAEGVDLDAMLSAYEERLLRAALASVGGNKTRAAELCHITFRSFRHRWAKYERGEED